MNKSANQTVLITGASRGLGLALAREFAWAGYSLVLHCRSKPEILLNQFPGSCVCAGDLRNEIPRLVALAIKNNVSILVNNAGIYLSKSFGLINEQEFLDVLRVNLLVPMLLTSALWAQIVSIQGTVVNINSMAGRIGGDGESVYAASKAGLSGFSKTLKIEAVRLGVRIIDVHLGAMRTDMMSHRKDLDMLIDPAEAASVICGLCQNRRSLGITSLDICRSNR